MNLLGTIAKKMTQWVGTPLSLVVHTLFFAVIFSLLLFGVNLSQVLLILTTILSIEAIYLALFIQMTVNKTAENLEDVEEDIEDIQEDVKEDDVVDEEVTKTLRTIETRLGNLQKDLDVLKKKGLL